MRLEIAELAVLLKNEARLIEKQLTTGPDTR
jgi:hypothetical protein